VTRSEQIAQALKVLIPPADKLAECRRHIEHALDIMAATMRGVAAIKAQRAADRQSGRAYYAALERVLATSKAYACVGGAFAIPIAVLLSSPPPVLEALRKSLAHRALLGECARATRQKCNRLHPLDNPKSASWCT
jgi:hypothetical protein